MTSDAHFRNTIRNEFPLLTANPDLSYLDNAATTQKPEAVLTAIDRYYRQDNANVHRSLYDLAERSTMAFEDSRRVTAAYLNAFSQREIIFSRGATEALNLLSWSLSELILKEGDIILVSAMEHHANFVPWQQAAIRKNAEFVLIPALRDGTLDLDFLKILENDGRAEKVKIAAISHISNAFGTIHPVRKLSEWCQGKGIPLVLDAAQSLPHLHIDVQDIGADFLVFSGHKVYGPMGSGVLWGREEWLERMPPWQTGGEMISMVKPEKTTWNNLPYKFEAGTPDVAAAVGLSAALEWLTNIGIESLEIREQELELYTYKQLSSLEGVTLYGPSDPLIRRAVYSFNLEGIHSHDAAQYMNSLGIAVRSGHHCAQPAMR
ncbi:MAG: aminotransferase class V-fold PLP-dependent enzyme, partial [Spirochaetaceae bacterium]|nr:aminotransferase class V-fold PLP-dependent enzyme [Spirochaetaceae bacterium]